VAKVYEAIDQHWRDWIARQPLFFVATAPLTPDGRVNVSPKGPIGTLRVLDEHTVAYLDVVGSGAETIAHLRENGRIVVMLCAFEGPPRILRLHGRGEVVLAGDPEFEALVERAGFQQPAVAESRRAVVVVHVERIADSCGYGVPLMSYEGARPHQELSSAKRLRRDGPDGLRDYQREKNGRSIDGLPAVELAP
jgi:predicted pyridoxine 5'-phosphate oxidase superfamily flavin-nucleotide-binding protein